MGNQTKTINNVELFHGEAKNAANNGFLGAFAVHQVSGRLNLTEFMGSRKPCLMKEKTECAHGSSEVKVVKAVGRKGSIEVSPSFPKSYQSTNKGNNHGKHK
jgi:hypothetical protein